jgi:tRNA G46 methylase TrmB
MAKLAEEGKLRTWLLSLLTAVVTVLATTGVLRFATDFSNVATAQELTTEELARIKADEDCLRELEKAKQVTEARAKVLKTELAKADLEEKKARTELSKAVTEHIREDNAAQKGIEKDLEWIRRGVDRLMEAEMKKGNIP